MNLPLILITALGAVHGKMEKLPLYGGLGERIQDTQPSIDEVGSRELLFS